MNFLGLMTLFMLSVAGVVLTATAVYLLFGKGLWDHVWVLGPLAGVSFVVALASMTRVMRND